MFLLKRLWVLPIGFDHLSLFDVFFQVVVKWQGLQLCSGQDRSEGDRDDDGDNGDGDDDDDNGDDDDDGDNGDDSCQSLLKLAIVHLVMMVVVMMILITLMAGVTIVMILVIVSPTG